LDPVLLKIENLHTYFFTDEGTAKSVRGLDLSVGRGETVGLVGESGCGKSVAAQSIMRLVEEPAGRIVAGSILFQGEDLAKKSGAEMRRIRGNRIAMIFQEPMTSLNPVLQIGEQLAETLRLHRGMSSREALKNAEALLEKVRLSEPAKRLKQYPHELSGGMRQRVMIAMALSCNPALVIADEPTTALDVTIQAQILEMLDELQRHFGASILLITHDFGVVAELAERVAVMYAGQIVEEAPVDELLDRPLHPYTAGLIASIPRMDEEAPEDRTIPAIPGVVPSVFALPAGCAFQDRCEHVMPRCRSEQPELREILPGHKARCWLHAA
jgi:peptide/nickel transport system ATP-binding protein/oligopeptide transport system ATP-binding protein